MRGAAAESFNLPIAIDTDVGGAALAEGRWGAARGCRTYAYVTIGTGIGAGLVLCGSVHGTLHPEVRHRPVRRVPGDTFPDICPFHGDCLKGLASGPAIAARTGREGAELPDDHPIWARVAGEIADLTTALMLMIAPERIILGGGVIGGRPTLLPMIHTATVYRLASYLPGADARSIEHTIVSPESLHAGSLGGSSLALNALVECGAYQLLRSFDLKTFGLYRSIWSRPMRHSCSAEHDSSSSCWRRTPQRRSV